MSDDKFCPECGLFSPCKTCGPRLRSAPPVIDRKAAMQTAKALRRGTSGRSSDCQRCGEVQARNADDSVCTPKDGLADHLAHGAQRLTLKMEAPSDGPHWFERREATLCAMCAEALRALLLEEGFIGTAEEQ
jgi:hypothetical protein